MLCISVHSLLDQLIVLDCSGKVIGLYIVMIGPVVSRVIVQDMIEVFPPASRNPMYIVLSPSIASMFIVFDVAQDVRFVSVAEVQYAIWIGHRESVPVILVSEIFVHVVYNDQLFILNPIFCGAC